MMKETYKEYRTREITAKVYDLMATFVFEEDASKEEMEAALDFFRRKFYDETSSCEE